MNRSKICTLNSKNPHRGQFLLQSWGTCLLSDKEIFKASTVPKERLFSRTNEQSSHAALSVKEASVPACPSPSQRWNQSVGIWNHQDGNCHPHPITAPCSCIRRVEVCWAGPGSRFPGGPSWRNTRMKAVCWHSLSCPPHRPGSLRPEVTCRFCFSPFFLLSS